jgi:hypothetical protein
MTLKVKVCTKALYSEKYSDLFLACVHRDVARRLRQIPCDIDGTIPDTEKSDSNMLHVLQASNSAACTIP